MGGANWFLSDEGAARSLANRLTRRYKTAKVLSFGSPVGDWWVRVRVSQDDRKRAEEVAHGHAQRTEQSISGQAGLNQVC